MLLLTEVNFSPSETVYVMWWEMAIFILRCKDVGRKLLGVVPMHRKSSNGVLMLPARSGASTPCWKAGGEGVWTWSYNSTQDCAGSAWAWMSQKNPINRVEMRACTKQVFVTVTLIAAKLLPDLDLSEASALHFFWLGVTVDATSHLLG